MDSVVRSANDRACPIAPQIHPATLVSAMPGAVNPSIREACARRPIAASRDKTAFKQFKSQKRANGPLSVAIRWSVTVKPSLVYTTGTS